jgi:hypothetical protein
MGVDQPAAGVLVFTHNGGHHVEGLTAYMRLTSASPPWAVWAQPEPAVGGLGFSQKNQGGISGIPALPPAAAWAQPEPAVGGLGFTGEPAPPAGPGEPVPPQAVPIGRGIAIWQSSRNWKRAMKAITRGKPQAPKARRGEPLAPLALGHACGERGE